MGPRVFLQHGCARMNAFVWLCVCACLCIGVNECDCVYLLAACRIQEALGAQALAVCEEEVESVYV